MFTSARSTIFFPLALASALLVPACGGSTAQPNPKPDSGTPTAIGDPCTRPADPSCAGGTPQAIQGTCSAGQRCIPATCGGVDNGFPGGYCSLDCGTTQCPTGSQCVVLPNTGELRCLKSCDPTAGCRSGYTCQDPAQSGQQVCFPTQQAMPTGGTNNGKACAAPPATLPSAGFTTPNLLVPYGSSHDVFDAEGNVDVDGQGHAATSFTAVYGTGGSGMGVASYAEGVGFAPLAQLFNTTYGAGGYTSDPVVAYDRQATSPRLYLVWIDIQGSQSNPMSDKVMVAHSDMYGAQGTWSAPVQVSPDGDSAQGFIDKPWIVARNGTVIVTYDLQGGGAAHIRVVRSSDAGATWSMPIDADTSSAFRNLAQPVLDAAGDLWVVWYEGDFGGTQIVVGEQPAGTPAFTRNVVASGTIQPAFDDPSIAVTDDARSLWVTFVDNDPPTGSDLWATLSTDQGTTFGAPIKVTDDPDPKMPAPCATHFHAMVAVDAKGRPHVAWYDNRYLQGNAWYAYSSDNKTFSANAVINDAEFPFTTDRTTEQWLGDYMGVTVDAAKVYATWADPRDGASRMYFAERPLPP